MLLRPTLRRSLQHSTTRHLSKASVLPTRTYLYTVDDFGRIFLDSTTSRNFTSCYRDVAFLDFLYSRTRLNDRNDEESLRLRSKGWEFISPCGLEVNYLKPDSSVVVYQSLVDNQLHWAGSLKRTFDPSALLLADNTGYLYHPSPPRPSRRSTPSTSPSPYGEYSLLSSKIIEQHFETSLEMEEDGSASFVWRGKRYSIGLLGEGKVVFSGTKGT